MLEELELEEAFEVFELAANEGVANTSPKMVAADAATTAPRLIWFLSICDPFVGGQQPRYENALCRNPKLRMLIPSTQKIARLRLRVAYALPHLGHDEPLPVDKHDVQVILHHTAKHLELNPHPSQGF